MVDALPMTRFARVFAPKLPITIRLPFDADSEAPIRWTVRMVRNHDFRTQVAVNSMAAAARAAGDLPSVADAEAMVTREETRLAGHVDEIGIPICDDVTGKLFRDELGRPSYQTVTDRDEIAQYVNAMTPTAYRCLEEALMGSAELSFLEKKS